MMGSIAGDHGREKGLTRMIRRPSRPPTQPSPRVREERRFRPCKEGEEEEEEEGEEEEVIRCRSGVKKRICRRP